MQKIKQIITVVIFTTIVTSCSGPTERVVKADNVEFSGMAGKHLKVVDGDYKFTNNGDDAFITVELELTKKPTEKVCEDYVYGGLRINPIGESGQIFDTGTYGFVSGDNGKTKILDLINSGNIGDKKSISFEWDYYGISDDDGSQIFENANTFEIIDDRTFNLCSIKEQEEKENSVKATTSNTSSNNSSQSNSDVGSTEWDDALDSYEEYIDQYAKLYKKMQNGDTSAMSEYPAMMQKATDFSEKLEDAGDELSTKQMTRFLKLQTKFTEVIQNLN